MSEKSESKIGTIFYYNGIVMISIGLLQLISIITSIIYNEWHIATLFIMTMSISICLGSLFMISGFSKRKLSLSFADGMVVAASAWFIGTLLGALPYYFSGNYLSYVDACFDVMSGLTTTGLTMIQDLDHVSNGVNMWRHILTFLGGQGMVVLALTFLSKGQSGVYKMYVGEAKDEKLLPNAISTARRIWYISMVYLVIGTLVMTITALLSGIKYDRAILHGMWIFMSSWSTGGFAPMSQNMLYYHSLPFELATMIFSILGSFNFALHHALFLGKRKELRKNIETITFTCSVVILIMICTAGLLKMGTYTDALSLFRKGVYQLVSGHTTTGFMTIYAKQFYYEWGEIALFAMIIAMLLGGSASSTAGGFKALRVGMIFSTFKTEIKRMLLPESRISEQKIHHIKDLVLSDRVVKSAFLIVMAYIITFTIGTLAGMFAGYPLSMSAFESASVTGNVGLSIGITTPFIPLYLKLVYIIIMWLARLEFMSVFVLIFYLFRKVRKA